MLEVEALNTIPVCVQLAQRTAPTYAVLPVSAGVDSAINPNAGTASGQSIGICRG